MRNLHISTTNPVMIPATQFVRQCREVLDSLQRGGEVIITRHQQQIARLVAIAPAVRQYTLADHLDSRYGQASPLDTDWAQLTYDLRNEPEDLADPWER